MAFKEVLYITYDGLTDALGQSQILPYIIGIAKNGYSFTIISCEKPENFNSGKQDIETICHKNNLEWHPLIYHKQPPVISTIKDVIQIKKKAYKLHKLKKFSIVHCRSYIPSLVGLDMKREKGVSFIFDMRGFWADERIDGKLWDLSNPIYKLIYKFFKSKEAAFIQHSDAIISLTEAGKKIILDSPTMKYSNKISVIPCSVDMDLFNRESLDQKKIDLIKKEIDSDMVIGYYGSLGTWYMFDEMFNQFVSIKKKYPKAKLLIITKEKYESNHILLAKQNKIDLRDIIIKSAERDEMPYYMTSTNIGIFFIKPCYSKLASSPTKHGEMLSMGLPLITNSGVGDVDNIVIQSNSGFIISNFNHEEYDKATEFIPSLLKLDPISIRNSCNKIYSLDIALDKYLQVYKLIENKIN